MKKKKKKKKKKQHKADNQGLRNFKVVKTRIKYDNYTKWKDNKIYIRLEK